MNAVVVAAMVTTWAWQPGDPLRCADRAAVVERFADQFGEAPVAERHGYLLMGNAEKGTWTILRVVDGELCPVAVGNGFTPGVEL